MICPSMPIHASTEHTEFVYILCRKKLSHPHSAPPSVDARGHICSSSLPLSAATHGTDTFYPFNDKTTGIVLMMLDVRE